MSTRSGSGRLAPVGPLGMLDRAFELARDGGLRPAGKAWAGGGLVATVVLGIYYVERVEGVRTLRPALALALALAWWGRAWLLGRAARMLIGRLWNPPKASDAGRPIGVLRTSIVTGAGIWVWSWLLVAGSLGGVVGVLSVMPLMALRGGIAPSWVARSASSTQAGFGAFARAFADQRHRRAAGVLIEALVLAGALGLAVNLYVATFLGVLLARSFVGFEVTAIESFLSLTNTWVPLTIGAAALVLLEPLRAALSAALYVDARVRSDGLDLRALVEDALRRSDRRQDEVKATTHAAVMLLACVCAVGVTSLAVVPGVDAQDVRSDARSNVSSPAAFFEPPEVDRTPYIAIQPRDRTTQDRVDEILARPEFREFEDHRGEGARDLVERLFRWLFRPPAALPSIDRPLLGQLSLPGPWFFLGLGAVLLLGVGLYLYLTRRGREDLERANGAASGEPDLRDRAPASFLDEAARLADAGDLRQALRALYLATLVALDRRRLIVFDPHRTNWQYLRQMPGGPSRDAFRQFTALFDHKWYGREGTTQDDYERCRTLASEIVGGQGAMR